MDVTLKTLDELAALSRLELKEEEKAALLEDLKRILDFVSQLDDADDGNNEALFLSENTSVADDKAEKTITREEALRNAPASDGIYFRVPKVKS